MDQLLARINQLLESHAAIRGAADFIVNDSSGEQWYEAAEVHARHLKVWADQVETFLRIADRPQDLQAWQDARQEPVDPLNVHIHSQGLFVLLSQIKANIERDHHYAPDLAMVTATPLLSDQEISDAHKMSELYVVLHCYENSVRHLIDSVLSKKYGENWWERVANSTMQGNIIDRINNERKKKWISPRGNNSPLYYADWGDLVRIVHKEEACFTPYIGELIFFESRFAELEALRNIVAHNGVLPSEDDFQRVLISFRDWCRQLRDTVIS